MIEYRPTWEEMKKELIKHFPEEKDAINSYKTIQNRAKSLTNYFFILKVLPKWIPKFIHTYFEKKV